MPPVAPINKSYVCGRIDGAARAYRDCWNTLALFKTGITEGDYHRLADFQPCLAQAIHDLDRCYDDIRREERAYITKKETVEHGQFASRMAELAGFRDAVNGALKIGLSLGDAFAWFFYLRSPEMIPRQVSKPRVKHTPPGLGGIGELAFVKTIRRFKHYFPIYHGITTMLRSGDFSLVDLRDFKVAALVELKTSRVNENTLSFSLNVISPQKLDDLAEGFSSSIGKAAGDEKPADIPGFKERLKRQIKTMGSVVEKSADGEHVEQYDAYHIKELRELGGMIAQSPSAYKQTGPGLLLLAVKIPEAPLSGRIFDAGGQIDIASVLPDLAKEAIKLVRPNSAYNSLITGELYVSLPLGATPLFWWPVDSSFLEGIFFRDVWIGAIYNPAHFAEKLIAKGFVIEGKGNPNHWSVHKPIGDLKAKLEGFDYFLRVIQYHLMREDAAVDIIEKTMTAGQLPGSRVVMNINHQLL